MPSRIRKHKRYRKSIRGPESSNHNGRPPLAVNGVKLSDAPGPIDHIRYTSIDLDCTDHIRVDLRKTRIVPLESAITLKDADLIFTIRGVLSGNADSVASILYVLEYANLVAQNRVDLIATQIRPTRSEQTQPAWKQLLKVAYLRLSATRIRQTEYAPT